MDDLLHVDADVANAIDRLAAIRRSGVGPSDLVDDLAHALEQLQVAREELRTGQEALLAQQRLAEQAQRRYQLLFTTAPVALAVTDADGVLIEANELAADLLGLPEGPPATALPSHVAEEGQREVRTALGRLAAGEATRLHTTLQDAGTGRRTEVEARLTALPEGAVQWALVPEEDWPAGLVRHRELLHLLGHLGDALTGDYDAVDFLVMVCEGVVHALDVQAAGVILTDGDIGRLQLAATSGPDARLVEQVALQTMEGPCVEAVATGRPVVIDDVAEAADRWPYFAAACAEVGVTAVASLPLRDRDAVFGAVNAFRKHGVGFGELDLTAITKLAEMAAISMVNRKRYDDVCEQVGHLTHALESRVIIEQAKGMVAEHLHIEIDRAFELLRRHARSNNRRLHGVAEDVVARRLSGDDIAT